LNVANLVDPVRIAALLQSRGSSWGGPARWVASTASTQDDARQAAAQGAPEGAVFVADAQTRGRGRQGRAWITPPGSALLASVVLRPGLDAPRLPPLSLVVGLAVRDAAARRVPGAAVTIKWPNDVLIDGRKLAGILVEASIRGDRVEAAIAGFGLNLREAALPPEIAARATCLERHGATDLDAPSLLVDTLVALESRLRVFVRAGLGPLLPELRSFDGAHGRRVRGLDGVGIASGIADDGRLLVATDRGLVAVAAGEVTFDSPEPGA
jgi:BirA family biotin operon repressor/biotin-[acetyl-CoA-carboxylase] ligase